MASEYLLKHPRTLRQACRDITTAHPELTRDCDACALDKLCAICEQIERHQLDKVTIIPKSQGGKSLSQR